MYRVAAYCAGFRDLPRESLRGDRPALDGRLAGSQGLPEPLVLIDFTAAGDLDVNETEVLHYAHDALASIERGHFDDHRQRGVAARALVAHGSHNRGSPDAA